MNKYNLNNKSTIDKQTLLDIFETLNIQLADNNLQLDLVLYGGSLMNLLYDNRPATRDIDCIFSSTDYKLLDYILNNIKDLFGLGDNWLNDDISEPLKVLVRQDINLTYAYSNLNICTIGKEQLLAMKILSARPEPAKDFIDSYILCKDLNIQSREQLLDVVKHYIPLKLLRDRQLTFIKYLGEDLGYDW